MAQIYTYMYIYIHTYVYIYTHTYNMYSNVGSIHFCTFEKNGEMVTTHHPEKFGLWESFPSYFAVRLLSSSLIPLMGVFINGGTPKWMVYNRKSHEN